MSVAVSREGVYMARFEDRWGGGVAGYGLRYICLKAYSKTDARLHLRGYKRLALVKARVDDDFALLAQRCGQEVRKLIYEGATSVADLDRLAPGWRSREIKDRLSR